MRLRFWSTGKMVTVWSGLLLSDGEASAIYALWHLTSTPAEDEGAWESILAGADLFYSLG